MGKRRVNLIASRIKAGFRNQSAFVSSLKDQGLIIQLETYANIENGRAKKVDVIHALVIAKALNQSVEDIFFV